MCNLVKRNYFSLNIALLCYYLNLEVLIFLKRQMFQLCQEQWGFCEFVIVN